MKILEKKEMQSIQGGTCRPEGRRLTVCNWIQEDRSLCTGWWDWDGVKQGNIACQKNGNVTLS